MQVLFLIVCLSASAHSAFTESAEDFYQAFDEDVVYFTVARGELLSVPDRGVYITDGTVVSSIKPVVPTEHLTIGIWQKWEARVVFQYSHLQCEKTEVRLGTRSEILDLPNTWSFVNIYIQGRTHIELAENEHRIAVLASDISLEAAPLLLSGGTGFLYSVGVSHSSNSLYFPANLSECPLDTYEVNNTCVSSVPVARQLVTCHSECATCVASTSYNNDCASCSGSRKLVQGFCQTGTCPNGFTDGTNTCTLSDSTPIDLHFENVISGTHGGWNYGFSDSFYPSYDANDPFPAKNRGYYFNGNAYATLSNFIYPPSFTIAMWVRPLSHSVLLEKGLMQNYYHLQSTSSGIVFKYDAFYSASHSDALTLSDWNYLAVSVSVSATATAEITIKVNNNSPGTYSSGRAITDDSTSTDLRLGYIPFNGFMYSLEIYVGDSDLSTSFVTSGCSSTCSNGACPPEMACPSSCSISQYIDTSGCSTCTIACQSNGCVRSTDCVLCEDPTDTSCTQFSSGPTCHSSCQTCTSTAATGCSTCAASYNAYDALCVSDCPTGYPSSSSTCTVDATGGFVFHIELTKVEDIVTDSQSSIPVLTGTDNSFYPTYDNEDPVAAGDCRGYHFSGSAFMQLPPYNAVTSPLLMIAAKFTMTAWVYPQSSSSMMLFSKVDSSYTSLFEVGLNGLAVDTTFRLTSGQVTYTSTTLLTSDAWSFVAVKGFVAANDQFNVEVTINGSSETSSDLGPGYLLDEPSSFHATIGATYQGSFQSFYTGFLWELRLYNYALSSYAALLDSSTCTGGCTYCPVSNSNTCLCSCDIDEYYSGPNHNSCTGCLAACTDGCISGTTCNLCYDVLCLECSDYSSTGCTACKTNASTLSDCECDANSSYDATSETCVKCLGSFVYDDICLGTCPTGYPAVGNVCTYSTSRIFELTLDKLEGVLYDPYNAVPAVTGATAAFYPDFETSDPYPVYRRGFYFAGDDYIQLPENSLFTSPNIVIGPDATLQLWLKPVSTTATVTCRYDSSYSVLLCVRLDSLQIKFDYNFSGGTLATHSCATSLSTTEWNHIYMPLVFDGSADTALSCHINRITEVSHTKTGFYADETSGVVFILGAGQTAASTYSAFYQGFIYQLLIDNALPVTSQTTIGCSEGCPICLVDNTCLVNCELNEYWVGPLYNQCAACDAACVNGCRSDSSVCNLCDNTLCESCTDYTDGGCTTCKANASPTTNCTCEADYTYFPNTELCAPNSCDTGKFLNDGGVCEDCPAFCLSCTSATCLECQAGYSYEAGSCTEIVCGAGQYLDAAWSCQDCTAFCVECTSAGCIECASGYVYDSGTDTCAGSGCETAQYLNAEGSCEDCSAFCLECTSAGCTECEALYTLADGTCIGMSFTVQVHSDNDLTLTFSVPLQNSLTSSDVTIDVEGSPEFSSYMDGEGAEYDILLRFKERVEEGTRVTVTIDESVVGVNGETLVNTADFGSLSFHFPTDAEIENMMSILGPVTAGMAISAALLSGNTAAVWPLVNTLQLIYFVPLGAYPLGVKLRTFFLSLLNFSIIPNLLEYWIDSDSGEKPYQEAYEFGFDTNLFLLNIGDALTAFGLLIALYPLFVVASWIPQKAVRTLMRKVRAEYKFSFYIRWWIEVFLELLISGFIQVLSTESTKDSIIWRSSLSIAFVCLLALGVSPIILAWKSWLNAREISAPTLFPYFHKLWGSFFFEFDNQKSFANNLFYLFFFLRRLTYACSQVFLNSSPAAQASLNIVHSVCFAAYVLLMRPFRGQLFNWVNMLTEVVVSLVFIGIALPVYGVAESAQEEIETTLIIGLSVTIGAHILLSVILFARSIIELIRKRKRKLRANERRKDSQWVSSQNQSSTTVEVNEQGKRVLVL